MKEERFTQSLFAKFAVSLLVQLFLFPQLSICSTCNFPTAFGSTNSSIVLILIQLSELPADFPGDIGKRVGCLCGQFKKEG
jgi:hypothetical protein